MQFWNAMRISYITRIIATMLLLIISVFPAWSQNSPLSQFGLGHSRNIQNIANGGMGGVSQAYSDGQTINFLNPASYADLQLTTLDVALEGGSSRVRDQDTGIFKSGYGTLSYLQLGVPLKKGGGWGLTFGLTPLTRIDYNIQHNDSLKGINEPVSYLYQGNGGAYKAFVGTGFRIKGFRFGINAGYLFGSKDQSIEALYPPDSIALFNSNTRQRTGFGGFFWDAGLQVHIKLGKKLRLELGGSGGLQQDLQANRDYLVETFYYSGDPANQSPQNQDTAYYKTGEKGNITYPGHYAFGFLLRNVNGNGKWMLGADYQSSQWSQYRYFGSKDSLQDSWTLRMGLQYVPTTDPLNTSYWKMVAYRIGFYTGQDQLRYAGTDMNKFAFTLGFGFPIRNFMRTGQYTLINTAFEFGKLGGESNILSENFFKLSVGFTLSDIWFVKRKYQ